MGKEPPGPFITSVLELKLDANTMLEWQKHSQDSAEVPHFNDLLEFLNMCAQASEVSDQGKRNKSDVQGKRQSSGKPVASFVGNASNPAAHCVLCKNDKHPLYVCPKFKSLSHEQMVTTLKEHSVCMNCPRPGHYASPSIIVANVRSHTTP